MEKSSSRQQNTMALKDGEAPKLYPGKCLTRLLKPIENDAFGSLFPLAAAMNFSYLYIRSPNRKTPWEKSSSRQQNTMALKDGEAPKLYPENA